MPVTLGQLGRCDRAGGGERRPEPELVAEGDQRGLRGRTLVAGDPLGELHDSSLHPWWNLLVRGDAKIVGRVTCSALTRRLHEPHGDDDREQAGDRPARPARGPGGRGGRGRARSPAPGGPRPPRGHRSRHAVGGGPGRRGLGRRADRRRRATRCRARISRLRGHLGALRRPPGAARRRLPAAPRARRARHGPACAPIWPAARAMASRRPERRRRPPAPGARRLARHPARRVRRGGAARGGGGGARPSSGRPSSTSAPSCWSRPDGWTTPIEQATRAASDAPLRERSQLLLMRALAGAGRAPDALRHAAAFRRQMAEETGLDPVTGARPSSSRRWRPASTRFPGGPAIHHRSADAGVRRSTCRGEGSRSSVGRTSRPELEELLAVGAAGDAPRTGRCGQDPAGHRAGLAGRAHRRVRGAGRARRSGGPRAHAGHEPRSAHRARRRDARGLRRPAERRRCAPRPRQLRARAGRGPGAGGRPPRPMPPADGARHEPGAARPARGAAVPPRPAPGPARRCAAHRVVAVGRAVRGAGAAGGAGVPHRRRHAGTPSSRCAASSTACRSRSSWPPVGWPPSASTGSVPAWGACSTWSSAAGPAGPAPSATPTS